MAYRNRLEALQGLSYFGTPDKKAAAEMYAIIDDQEDDFRLGGVAGSALGQIADGDIYAVMLQKINDGSAEERVRISYAQGLWRKPNAELSAALMPVLEGDAPAPIKRAAAFAIGYAGSPANDAKLMELLDNPTARRDAVIAAVLGGSPEAAEKLVGVLAKDRDAEEVLRMHVNSNEDDFFNVLSETNFTSGQIYRRLTVAEILKGGTEKMSYGYVWTQLITRLRTGWDGPGGVSPRFIRTEFYKTLTGDDADKRALAARVLASMNLRGLLLAARDAKIDEARQVLLEMDRPKQAR
jgi:HEAT repeat protein